MGTQILVPTGPSRSHDRLKIGILIAMESLYSGRQGQDFPTDLTRHLLYVPVIRLRRGNNPFLRFENEIPKENDISRNFHCGFPPRGWGFRAGSIELFAKFYSNFTDFGGLKAHIA